MPVYKLLRVNNLNRFSMGKFFVIVNILEKARFKDWDFYYSLTSILKII